CQYKVKLISRFQAEFPEFVKIVANLIGTIGPLHIMGHVPRCKALFNANTTTYVGHLNGDSVEQPFAETKTTGGSTKHMNEGHREDTLDDFFADWNFRKMGRLGTLH